MRKTMTAALALGACLMLANVALADARGDVIIRDKLDDERNTIFELINTGDKRVVVKVKMTKTCEGQSNNDEPQIREHWVGAGSRVRLGRTRAGTSCPREYRIVSAEYR